jgi:hypothetical protein
MADGQTDIATATTEANLTHTLTRRLQARLGTAWPTLTNVTMLHK